MSLSANQPVNNEFPFDLTDDSAYLRWRDIRQPYRLPQLSDILVQIEDPENLSAREKAEIIDRCHYYNMAIYQLKDINYTQKSLVHALGEQLSMGELDSNLRSDEENVSSLEVRPQSGNQYIPYTNKALSWHTDGYYNALDKQIYGIVMHCVRPAASGGENTLLNPESIYIALRDENPAYIEALMHPQAMTIPENVENGEIIRQAQPGPVFMVKDNGQLHMRYSARKRNIIWRETENTVKAVETITRLLSDEQNALKVTLAAGQGIICNNVLHNRNAFSDSEENKRLLYRARYYGAVRKL